jgi:hypothetical protein
VVFIFCGRGGSKSGGQYRVGLLFASICQRTLRVPIVLFLPSTESGHGDIEETDLEG